MRSALVGAFVIAALLAGCSGGKAGEPGSGPTPADLKVDGASADGAISGVVVDEAIRPLAGVVVTMSGGRNATSDKDGLFAFEGVQPGFVVLNAAGSPEARLLPVQVTADVVAGQTAKVKVQMQHDPTPVPYHQTLSFKGFMQAWAGIGQYYLETATNGTQLCQCYLAFTPDAGLKGMVVEATWDAQAPDPGAPVDSTYYWEVDQGGPAGDEVDSGYCHSPCRADAVVAKAKPGQLTAYLQGPDEYVAAQQPFDLYVTLFYVKEQPAGWSFVGGDP